MASPAADGGQDPIVTVLIRAKDEAEHIGRTLDIVRSQTIADRLQVLVVDSGSRDATVTIAAAAGAEVAKLAPEAFSYGGALNYGCERARADIVISLSAHAFPRSSQWAERILSSFDDPRVACVSGCMTGPYGDIARDPIVQDLRLAKLAPYWGYSNHAGGFRRALWEQRPFRADMPYTEDKEWAWQWLQKGYTVVLDPLLLVDHEHVESWLAAYRRECKMWTGFGMFLELPHYGLRDLLSEWSADPRLRARASPHRLATLIGGYCGRRMGR
jgi:rhamnosyltransferase